MKFKGSEGAWNLNKINITSSEAQGDEVEIEIFLFKSELYIRYKWNQYFAAPNQKMKEVLTKTVSEAQKIISKVRLRK